MRRNAILLAGAAAVLPALAPGWAARAAEPRDAGSFVAPEEPLILTRTLRRGLVDGKEVVTRRRYEVRIVPDRSGYRVDGRLLDTHVEAPQELDALAAIERARPDIGLFPMYLDSAGLIVRADRATAEQALARARSEADATIAGAPLSADEKGAAAAFVEQVHRTRAGVTPIPSDLFRPREGRRLEHREIGLPDGQVGEVTVEIEARTDEVAGLLESLDQTVVTELAGTRRTNRERWTLSRPHAHGIILPPR